MGLTWDITDEFRARATRSHDIRAPNLTELYAGTSAGHSSIVDFVRGPQFVNAQAEIYTQGNPNLKPEDSDTTTLGLVYQPEWLPGFSASVDAYQIEISNAIASVGAQKIVQDCAAGSASQCAFILRNTDGSLFGINTEPQNLQSIQTEGVDFESSYNFSMNDLVGFGGDYTRLRTDCRLVGRGATGDLAAAYFGDGDQTLDYRTFQDHVAPDTTSNLLFKGAVSDRSRSVYTGLIRVGKDARGTNAFQTNRNLKLSEDAWAESIPNLVIENNDVHCSHASAVGPIDEEQRFYLESRGVPTVVAERLVVAGFFAEVLDQLPDSGLRSRLDGEVAAKLQAVLAS